jgi:hypothetical protein
MPGREEGGGDGNAVAGSLGPPDLHLTCVKTVGSLAGCVAATHQQVDQQAYPMSSGQPFPLALMAAMTTVTLMLV